MERRFDEMDKEQFFNTQYEERVKIINKMLKDSSPKEVAQIIGIPDSTFSKEMMNGDYVYIKRDKKYYKFLRAPNSVATKDNLQSSVATQFIEENLETLRSIISDYNDKKKMLILDERVYNKKAKYVNKSIKMNSDVYEEFVKFCEEKYPYLTIQDLVAQSLLDFIENYNGRE